MAFVALVGLAEAHVEAFRQDGEECAIVIPVGVDEEEGRSYALVVGLSPAPPGNMEFYFGIAEIEAGGDERLILDSAIVARLIPRGTRQQIRIVLMRAAHAIVSWTEPECFHMTTYTEHLPAVALSKYVDLAEVFGSLGYNISGPDPYHGRRVWWAERPA